MQRPSPRPRNPHEAGLIDIQGLGSRKFHAKTIPTIHFFYGRAGLRYTRSLVAANFMPKRYRQSARGGLAIYRGSGSRKFHAKTNILIIQKLYPLCGGRAIIPL